MSSCWINGNLVDDHSAAISIRDTGLLHGAGIFTTMRAYRRRVFRLDYHLERLRRSAQAMFVPISYSDEQISSAIAQLLEANELTEARLRLTITRGTMSNDPVHGLRLDPNIFITATALEAYPQEYYQKGMTVLAYDQQKANPFDVQAGHKTLDYFSRFTAMRQASNRGAGEALWFNIFNYLQSGSISNVFIVKNSQLLTPPTQQDLEDPLIRENTPYPASNVLPGITRRVVLELARSNDIPVQIKALAINDLLDADECFLTNSIMEIMPVCRIERKPIGQDRPGDLTQKLVMLYRTAVDQFVGSD